MVEPTVGSWEESEARLERQTGASQRIFNFIFTEVTLGYFQVYDVKIPY